MTFSGRSDKTTTHTHLYFYFNSLNIRNFLINLIHFLIRDKLCINYSRTMLIIASYTFYVRIHIFSFPSLGGVHKLRWQGFGLFGPPTHLRLHFLPYKRWLFGIPNYLPTLSFQHSLWTPTYFFARIKEVRDKV